MSGTEDLVPVFIPSLASVLARAEELKGSALTEAEAITIRDSAVCQMVSVAHAESLTESRGYHDVNPENCWSDWHRLRVQFTGNGFLPTLVLCVLGDANFRERSARILYEAFPEVEQEWRQRDPRMVEAFQASMSSSHPTVTAADFESIERHESVLYLVNRQSGAGWSPRVSARLLSLGGALLESGGLAMKCESSGISHGRDAWIMLTKQLSDTTIGSSDFWAAMFDALVQFPISNGKDIYSCGMHLLGQPDVIVSESLLQQMQPDVPTGNVAVYLFTVFCLYLLDECAPGAFGSGHTFAPDAVWPRLRVTWEPCRMYEEDDFFHNPFGLWRFDSLA